MEGADEAMESFRNMARFTEKLFSSFQRGPMAGMLDNPFRMMDRMEGIPVLTRQFEGGRPVREIALKSAARQELEDGLFEPPQGYKEADIMKMAGGR